VHIMPTAFYPLSYLQPTMMASQSHHCMTLPALMRLETPT
jgi:hypothetical protein